MVFKRLLGSLGVGGPTVDTVLDPAPARPGSTLTGQVHLKGGNADFDIDHITLELVARVEAEHEEGESEGVVVFSRFTVGGGFRLGEGETRSVPFTVVLPWETPVTELYGQGLGIVLGARTELAVSRRQGQGRPGPADRRTAPGPGGNPRSSRPTRVRLQVGRPRIRARSRHRPAAPLLPGARTHPGPAVRPPGQRDRADLPRGPGRHGGGAGGRQARRLLLRGP